MDIREINKGDIICILKSEYEAVDRIDMFNDAQTLAKSLSKIEIRLHSRTSEKESLLMIDKEKTIFFNEELKSGDYYRFSQKKVRLNKLVYKVIERTHLSKSENFKTYFEKMRILQSKDNYIIIEKMNDGFTIFKGEKIKKEDIEIISRGKNFFVPNRSFIIFEEIPDIPKSITRTILYALFFLFFGLLYISPFHAVASFAIISSLTIIFGWEMVFYAPLICIAIGVWGATRINRKKIEF